jgi:hypothetical protein
MRLEKIPIKKKLELTRLTPKHAAWVIKLK